MKPLHLVLFASLWVPAVIGAPDNIAANRSARLDAIALLRQGKVAESKQRLTSVRGTDKAPGNDLDTGQQWVAIAFHVRACGESDLARQAAVEAVALATTLPQNLGTNSERASFLTNAGLVCERILHDADRARAFYNAAVAADPVDKRAKERLAAAEAKVQRRQTGKGGSR